MGVINLHQQIMGLCNGTPSFLTHVVLTGFAEVLPLSGIFSQKEG